MRRLGLRAAQKPVPRGDRYATVPILKRLVPLALLFVAGCGELPRDTAGTSERVRGGVVRVGQVAGDGDPRLAGLLTALARRMEVRPRVYRSQAEPLLMRLETGELDLVVSAFDRSTPWSKRVTFSKPLVAAEGPHGTEEVKAAVRNGEHRWSMEVDRVAAEVAER